MAQKKTEDAAYRLRIVGSESRVETAEEFKRSYFQEEYKSIIRAVWRVIESTRLDRERRKSAENYNRYSPDIRVHNIVPIIGRRGSGKSSILHSVAGILQDGVRLDSESDFWLGEYSTSRNDGKFRGIRFFVTESIDGSLLEHNEDIFPTILVQMKKMLPPLSVSGREDGKRAEGQYGGSRYQLRELHKELEKLFDNARQMEANACTSYRRDETTALSSMNQLSSSLRLRQDFRELLMKFLDYCASIQNPGYYPFGRVQSESYSRENCYLVIPIDDLDLNIPHGYEMLEKLHRYMMLPNVIILLAFDQKQFKRLCENEFYKMIPTFDSRMNAAARNIEELARQYLEKVMPLSQRTYVPSLDTRTEVMVKVENESWPNTPGEAGADSDEWFLPKYLVFRLIFEKLGMRMDTDGEKRHFFERRTLRNYVNLVNLLDRMSLPFQNEGGQASFREDVYRHNHQVFLQEIEQGMASAWLSDAPVLSQYRVDSATTTSTFTHRTISSKELFDQITEVAHPVPRAFRNFFFSVSREGKESKVGSTMHDLANSLDYYGFSYGEILHIIYHYGRISNDNKRLVHSLLAYYSLVLNQCYLDLRQQKGEQPDGTPRNEDNYKNLCNKFLQLMNGSVSGSWANAMVPVVWLSDKYYGSGLRRVNDMRGAFSIDAGDIRSFFGDKQNMKEEEKIGAFFRAVVVTGMLFDRPRYKLPELFQFESIDKNNEWYSYFTTLAEIHKTSSIGSTPNSPSFRPIIKGKGTFGFLNFVSTAFQFNDYLEKILKYTENYIKNNSGLFALQKKKGLDKKITAARTKIEKEFQKWDEDYFGFALPVYDIDVCYNLIKRLLQDRYGKPDYIGNGGRIIPDSDTPDLFDSYLEIYQSIADQLRKNDNAYLAKCNLKECSVSLGTEGPRPFYADAFRKCPFIKWLGIQPKEEDARPKQDTQTGQGGQGGKKLQPQETDVTKKLTKYLLQKTFEHMTLRSVDNRRCSESHEDKPNYTRTASYDD